MTHFFEAFFNPRGVAIIGASSDPGKLGYAVARNLIDSGYQGVIHLVNQKGGSLLGREMVTSIASIPDPVDLAVVIVPAPAAAQSLRELGQRGVRAAILTSGGFRETGAQGAKLEAEVLDVCHEYGIRLIGPNCVGLIDTHLPLDSTFLPPPIPPKGDVAFLSHSGAFCAAVIDWSRTQGLSFSRIISLGNQADLTESDLLPAVADDPHTKAICLYLETVSNGEKFLKSARPITKQKKPIIALKVGRTAAGQKAAASHTGALAGSEAALNATLEKAGVLRATTAEEMFDWAQALATYPLLVGKRIAVVTSAGGPGVIAADALEAEGLSLSALSTQTVSRLMDVLPAAASADNPVDMLASAGPKEYAECLSILLEAPEVDGALIITLPPPSYRAEDVADALIPLIQASAKPALVAQMGGHLTARAFDHFIQAHIPVYPFPERAASALGVLYRQSEIVQRMEEEPVSPLQTISAIGELSADELIATCGIPTTPLKLAASADEAAHLAREMGFPLVAKIASPDILHKSDIGGVLLDLDSVGAVVSGYGCLMERARSARPEARIEGITLQRQIPAGQDVIIGAVRDPQFGPLIMFGSGGIEAEGLKDVTFALAPLTRSEAEKMLQKTWAGKKLDGFRSIPPADKGAVIDALVRLSWLVTDHPEFSEIEINPLRALNQGVVALDIRMKID